MDPDLIKKIVELPATLQVTLASGFCAYLIAYMGIRYAHKATDTVFLSLAFGLVALFVFNTPLELSSRWQGVLAFCSSIFAGLLWRIVIRGFVRSAARKLNYSWADDTLAAWDCLHEDSKNGPTQLTVETNDGWTYYCSDAERVRNMPHGPYTFGTTGDVLMYVDRSEGPGNPENEVTGVFDPQWGNLVTYIPKERISRIAIRLTSPSAKEAEWKVWVRAKAVSLRRRLHLKKA